MRRRKPFHETVRTNPTCPPDWRWVRATTLVEQRKNASRKRDDGPTCAAVRYIRRLHQCVTEQAHQKLAREEPEISGALGLYQRGRLPALELRCRILARQTNRSITRRMGVSPGVVGAYRSLFFDVGNGSPGYVTRVIAKVPPIGPPPMESLMLSASYFHGPIMVDAWVDYLLHQCESHDLSTPEGRTRKSIELLLRTHQFPDSEAQRWNLVRKLPFVQKSGEKLGSGRTVSSLFCEKVSESLKNLLPEDHRTGSFSELGPSQEQKTQSQNAPRRQSA